VAKIVLLNFSICIFLFSGLAFSAEDTAGTNDASSPAASVPTQAPLASPVIPPVPTTIQPDDDNLFVRFVKDGGPIVWYILIPMSVVTVGRTLELLFLTRRRRLLPSGVADEVISLAGRLDTAVLISRLVSAKDFVRRAVHRTLIRAKQDGVQPKRLEAIAADCLQEQALALLRKAELCNIFGNVAPMVGLFGTVVGIIKALHELGVSRGQPRPDLLAEHISVALVATFWGLLVAIPSLAVHGLIRTRIESIVGQAAAASETVLRAIRLPLPETPRSADGKPQPVEIPRRPEPPTPRA
jgi:biopolymer transport protein ExbB